MGWLDKWEESYDEHRFGDKSDSDSMKNKDTEMFNENGYDVRKKVLSKQTCEIIHEYYKIKIQNDEFLFDNNDQVNNTINMYGDTLNDAILKWTLPIAEDIVGEELYPCYTFMRVYNQRDQLNPHVDRPSCEFSATLPIYFDEPWPISMQKFDFEKYGDDVQAGAWESVDKEPSKAVILKVGDMCFYEGTKMNHWRLPYHGTECIQLFIHYVRKHGEYSEFKFDKRKNLGLPDAHKKEGKKMIEDFLFND